MGKTYYKQVDAGVDVIGNPVGPDDVGVPLWYSSDWKAMTEDTLNQMANALIPFGLTLCVVDIGEYDYYMWGISNV